MTDTFLPLSVDIASVRFRYLDSTGVSRNPYSGSVRTASRGGDKVGASLEFTVSGGSSATGKQRARKARQVLWGLRGKQGRLVLTDPSYTPAGSFPTGELLANNDFSNGTSGWSATASAVLSSSDTVLRLTASAAGSSPQAYRSVSMTQYAPHVMRSFISDGQQSPGLSVGNYIFDGTQLSTNYSTTARGIVTASFVPLTASAANQSPAVIASTTGYTAGAYIDCHWSSLSRCALADAGQNLLLQSDVFGTTWTVTRATITSNSTAAPDGTTTADTLNEDGTAASDHYVTQTKVVAATALDYTFSLYVKAGTRSWVQIVMYESTGSHQASCFFDVTNGVTGTSGASGANWTNVRVSMTSAGNGWYQCAVTARKASAATTIDSFVFIAEADADRTFSGATAASLYLWRGALAQSSFPTRGAQTTTTASSGTAQTGSGIYLKGLPVSTSGLLLADDWVEIITSLGSQLCKVMASLDSDAAGLGYLQIAPAIRGTVADNAPVIIHKPMGRFLFAGDVPEYMNEPGVFTTGALDLEESPF